MTSKTLFFRFFKENRRQKKWLWLLSGIVFFVFTLSFLMQGVVFYGEAVYFGLRSIPMMRITAVLAVLSAFQGYDYLLQTKTMDFYFAIPLRRSHLFLANFINGILLYLIPMLVSQLLCFFVILGTSGVHFGQLLEYTLWGIAVHALAYVFLYECTVACILLAGNIVMAACLLLGSLYYVQIVMDYIVFPMCRSNFSTFYKADILDMVRTYFVPMRLYEKLNGQFQTVYAETYAYHPEWLGMGIIIVGVIGLFGLIVFLHQKRKAEAVGNMAAFRLAESVIHVLVDISIAVFAGNLCITLWEKQIGIGVAGSVLTGILCYGIVEGLLRLKRKGIYRKKRLLLAEIGMAAAILLCFFLGQDKYDSYIPRKGQIAEIGLGIDGLDSKELYEDTETRLQNVRLNGVEMEKTYQWLTEEIMPKQQNIQELTRATVAYILKNGRTVYRAYPIGEVEQLEKFSEVYATEAYKKGIYEIFSYANYDGIEIAWTNEIENMSLDLDETQTEQFLKIYKEELAAQDIEALETEFPIGRLLVSDEEFRRETVAYLYPGFEKTMKLLEGYGVPAEKRIEEYALSKVETTVYGDAGKFILNRETYTEAEEMKEQVQNLVYQGYAIQPVLHPVDTKKEVVVKFQNESRETVYKVKYYRINDPDN